MSDSTKRDETDSGLKRRAVISLSVTQSEPRFVEFYKVADASIDLLRDTVNDVLLIPQSGRQERYAAQWTAYLGTLLEETAGGVAQLLVLDMPRAAVILNRQVFEYGVRLLYLYAHPDKAEALMDSLQWRVWREAKAAPGFFGDDDLKQYEENYKAWVGKNPQLNSEATEENFTRMAQEVLGDRYSREFFLYYSIPSIIGHGKPHGLIDVLEAVGEGVMRHYDSRTIDAVGELSKLIYFLIHTVFGIRLKYGLSLEEAYRINGLHTTAQAFKIST